VVEYVSVFGAHDLLHVDPQIAQAWPDAPPWVFASLVRAPWVVVRRDCERDDVPVGVRGNTRAERYATRIAASQIARAVTPDALLVCIPSTTRPLDRAAALLRDAAARCGVHAGLTGAYGFELTSATCVTHPGSDLDAVVADAPCARLATFAAACGAIAQVTGVRLDIEVLVPEGGVALAELLATRRPMLVKTNAGPVLIR